MLRFLFVRCRVPWHRKEDITQHGPVLAYTVLRKHLYLLCFVLEFIAYQAHCRRSAEWVYLSSSIRQSSICKSMVCG